MTIKTRTVVWIVGIVSFLMLVLCGFIYLEFQSSEQSLFQQRLSEKGINTVRLLDEVKEVDSALLKLIDQNTINQIRDEKVWVYDAQNKLVYSSIDDMAWQPSNGMLDSIRQAKFRVFTLGDHDAVGLIYAFHGVERLVISAGKDQEGKDAQLALLHILLIGILVILILVGITAYLVAKQVLKPLFQLHQEVESINDQRLNLRIALPDNNTKDEISALANSFNAMLERIQEAFSQQKQFIQHASHELRTPLAALTNQIDLALQQDRSSDYYKALLISLQEDHDRLAQLVQQLLVLFRSGQSLQQLKLEPILINEIVEECMEQVQQIHPQTSIGLNYIHFPELETDLQINGNRSLIGTALLNLLENACKYGNGLPVKLDIAFDDTWLEISILNQGPLIPTEDRGKLFTAFFRSANTEGKKGFGLGLLLSNKITQLHQGHLSYQVIDGQNCFVWKLPKELAIH